MGTEGDALPFTEIYACSAANAVTRIFMKRPAMSRSAFNPDHDAQLQEIAMAHGCSLRTAAGIIRQKSSRESQRNKQASDIAAPIDWGNTTDIPSEIREMSDAIAKNGRESVAKSCNNLIGRLPRAIQVSRD